MQPQASKKTSARNLLLGAGLLFVAGLLIGFVPEFLKVRSLESEESARQQQIQELQEQIALGQAKDHAAMLYLDLTQQNYGLASQHATAFFNSITRIAQNTRNPDLRAQLQGIAGRRNDILTAISKADPGAVGPSAEILKRMSSMRLAANQ